MKVKGNHVIYSLVLLFTGFILAFSFQLTSEHRASPAASDQPEAEDELRNHIIRQQAVNQELTEELRRIQSELSHIEEEAAGSERRYFNLVENVDRLRMITGEVPVAGEGIEVRLDDAAFVPEDQHANNFIVHEQHVQKVIDELFVTGAEAVAVNGHRINHQTYIQCIGPVIEIDGNQSFAPFIITAIGDSEQLELSLGMTGGVVDSLVSENVEVRVQKKPDVTLDPYFGENEDSAS
ncbi:hypothetical protein CR205_04865 [Alteribacter lacisalsi]|uniref:DUF881 domain-containing protein n=1 Tax=Alteribacter lacisalsi TaxID=2045244 RepID=A0A2W0HDA7_9BACI|nr:DUF881 domain-containing protein [Alteribacter lacisalsi]PYZ97930.1 hypothetical protein CR205_04865 [Alteribacter lacisalsi]